MAEKDASTRLRRAVKENNLFIVKRLCKKTDMRNPDPTSKRYTSLAWAAVLGHEETFEFLLGEGHDDREYSKDADNNTILILLADTRAPLSNTLSPCPSDHDFYSATLRMARLYFERYGDLLDWANVQGKTALHVAALKGNEDLVRMLCDFGADVDLADNDGNTALHYASAWGHIVIVQLLIERGCQYSVRNNEGFTPSDYAYSTHTKDVLQDTARAQFELNKRSRRNVYAQAAARGHEWGSLAAQMPPPPPPRMYGNGVRMRSGSGTSRTTTTSDSGEALDTYTPQPSRSHPALSSSLSPSRQPSTLPSASAYSPAQSSANGSASTFSTIPSPSAAQPHATLPGSLSAVSALSQYASRMRERDADAIEKYKNRQRSGSGATTSTDALSQNGGNASANGSSQQAEDNFAASLVSVGSVAPRRNLRPSASAAQLRSPTPGALSTSGIQPPTQEMLRNRSGTGPAMVGATTPIASQSPSDPGLSSTPTQAQSFRPGKTVFSGPPAEYARFAPPPPNDPNPPLPPPKPQAAPTSSRRLPFSNLLSSHHKHNSEHSGSHKRNSSLGARA